MRRPAVCEASPSLALLKYWGKRDAARNLPATPSLAVALSGLRSVTRARVLDPREGTDRVYVNGEPQPSSRYDGFFQTLRTALKEEIFFEAESTNNFPTSAGLASSSSGFAALSMACARAAGRELSLRELSTIARFGSASAARAVFGGFTLLPAGAPAARPLFDENYWPELRIIVCVVEEGSKKKSSRGAMESSRLSSPYYRAWISSSRQALPRAIRALRERDLPQLGEAMRLSYLRMFATMISTDPPTLYWLPESLEIIHECEEMRGEGLGVWETMDAGPQVKLLCLAQETEKVRQRIESMNATSRTIVCSVGGPPICSLEGSQ
jgi:diphosphomevalonate decarboxylase